MFISKDISKVFKYSFKLIKEETLLLFCYFQAFDLTKRKRKTYEISHERRKLI